MKEFKNAGTDFYFANLGIKKVDREAKILKHNGNASALFFVACSKYIDLSGNYVYSAGVNISVPSGYLAMQIPMENITHTGLILRNNILHPTKEEKPLTFVFSKISNGRIYDIGEKIGGIILIRTPQIVY